MSSNSSAHAGDRDGQLLPPRRWAISLLLQIPVLIWTWPPEPQAAPVSFGAVMLVAGCALNVWAVLLFRKSEVGVCPFSPVPRLVGNGPYRFTRNPMYLGLVLISASLPLLTGALWNLWSPAVLALWLHLRFVLPEEDFLEERLGLGYLTYASRTPRWLGLPPARLGSGVLRGREPAG